MNYNRGHDVHPIQANKALADRDSWRAADLLEVGDGYFTWASPTAPPRTIAAPAPATWPVASTARRSGRASARDRHRAAGRADGAARKDGRPQPGRIKPLLAFAWKTVRSPRPSRTSSDAPYELRFTAIARRNRVRARSRPRRPAPGPCARLTTRARCASRLDLALLVTSATSILTRSRTCDRRTWAPGFTRPTKSSGRGGAPPWSSGMLPADSWGVR